MVKNYFKLIVALVFATNVMAQNVPNYVPTNGLVGWWPFNGNANDESGNGNNGTVNGATLTTDRNGNNSNAFSFSQSQYIEIPNLYQNNINGYTICSWFKRSTQNADGAIVSGSYPGETPGGLRLNMGSINRFQWAIEDKPGVNGILQNSPGDKNNYCDNQWHHVVATFNSNNGKVSSNAFKIYVDGILVKVYSFHQNWPTWDTTVYAPINNGNRNTIIGNCGGSYSHFTNSFLGVLDDIAIYNRALTQEEITALYTGTPPCTNPTATLTPQDNTTFCQGGFVNLNATDGNTYSYQWYNNGQAINGATASTYQATTSGSYTVKITDGACNETSTAQVVTVNPLPYVSMNALNQFTLKNASPVQLVANPSGGIFSGDGVQGTTFNPSLTKLGLKTITYNYTSPQGCSGSTTRSTIVVDSIGNVCNITKYDTVKVTKTDTVSILKLKFQLTTGIKAKQYTSMNVFPNPASDVLIIEANDIQALGGYKYKILDLQGKEVYNALATSAKTEISLKTIGAKGMYILHIVDEKGVSIENKKIVLE